MSPPMHVTINFDVERPQLLAAQFPVLVERYLEEQSRRLNPSTIKSYRLRVRNFLDWWKVEGPPRDWMLGEEALAAYAQYVQSLKQLGWSSRNDALRRLRQVLRWAHRRSYVTVDFSEMVPTLRGCAPPRVPVDLGILSAMFEACEDTKEPERNQAMLAVLAGTGIRCEECCSLLAENVYVYEDGSGLIQLRVAKNNKPRTVAFDCLTGTYLCEWIVMLPYQEGPLFPSRNGRNTGIPVPITTSGQHKLLDHIAELAGVADQIQGPHDLRRLFATTWAKIVPEKAHLLQRQMGHVNFNTTLGYILGDPNDIREEITKHPVTPVSVLAIRSQTPKRVTPAQYLYSLYQPNLLP